jgi:hypothetical protein
MRVGWWFDAGWVVYDDWVDWLMKTAFIIGLGWAGLRSRVHDRRADRQTQALFFFLN